MFYIRTYFIQHRSNPEPFWLYEITSPFMAHLDELVLSGEMNEFT